MWKRTKKDGAPGSAEQSNLFEAAEVKEAPRVVQEMHLEAEMWRAAERVQGGAPLPDEWKVGEHLGILVKPEEVKIARYPEPSAPLFLIWLRVLFAALATARYRAAALASDERAMAAAYIKADNASREAWKRVEVAEAKALEETRGHLAATLRAEAERKRAEQAEAASAEARALVMELELDAEQYRAMAAFSASAHMEKDAQIARLKDASGAAAESWEVERIDWTRKVERLTTEVAALKGALVVASPALERETERSSKVREECVVDAKPHETVAFTRKERRPWDLTPIQIESQRLRKIRLEKEEAERAELLRRIEIAESAMASAARESVEQRSAAPETLATERAALLQRLEAGQSSVCPCCDQTVAAYKRHLHAGQALWLVDLVKAWRAAGGTPETWIHKSAIKAVGNDYGFLAYFIPEGHTEPLARHAPREFGSAFSGMWQPTEAGLAWLRGEVKTPRYSMVYNRRVLSASAEGVTVEQALGAKFDYSEVMPAPSAQERT